MIEKSLMGDPIDPVSFYVAVDEMWKRIAAHRGIDLVERGHHASRTQSQEAVEIPGDQIHGSADLYEEAYRRVWGLVVIEELKAWLGDGESWRRPTKQTLRNRVSVQPDQPIALYLDRVQVEEIADARWPEESKKDTGSVRRPRGRPRGSGTYADSDAPILIAMRSLVESGEELSVTAAAQRLAASARGPATPDSKAIRLRKAYFRKWPAGE